ncbi:MAG TPA: hypothetical protein VMJ35_11855 [Dongiaceae bacterium]|nr:hypothetical protein [Dongiaceae bacterium]
MAANTGSIALRTLVEGFPFTQIVHGAQKPTLSKIPELMPGILMELLPDIPSE